MTIIALRTYIQSDRKWLKHDGKFIEMRKLLHGRHPLLHPMDLLLQPMVLLLRLVVLIEEPSHPARALAVMQNLTMNRFILIHDYIFHIRYGHNVHKSSAPETETKQK